MVNCSLRRGCISALSQFFLVTYNIFVYLFLSLIIAVFSLHTWMCTCKVIPRGSIYLFCIFKYVILRPIFILLLFLINRQIIHALKIFLRHIYMVYICTYIYILYINVISFSRNIVNIDNINGYKKQYIILSFVSDNDTNIQMFTAPSHVLPLVGHNYSLQLDRKYYLYCFMETKC